MSRPINLLTIFGKIQYPDILTDELNFNMTQSNGQLVRSTELDATQL